MPTEVELVDSPAGRDALAVLESTTTDDPLALAASLRTGGITPDVAAAVLTQRRLRDRAVTKFGPDAAVMYFTPDGLQQATRPAVAARRAARFVAAGARHVVDLGCGIGADLIAMARAGLAVTGVERDPATAAAARANLAALGLNADVVTGDATDHDLTRYDAAFCDPARRSGGRRVFDPDAYSPRWDFLLDVAARVPLTAVKVAPGIDHARVPSDVEAEWVSDGGDLVEAALWFGALGSARHRATVLPAGDSLTGSGTALAPSRPDVGAYVHDPDGAVVRSHLVAELATVLGASTMDPTIAYLTSDECAPTSFARTYVVDEVLPFSVKRLRAALRARDVGAVEIKKRGTAVTPEQLRPQLRLAGSGAATVILTRIAGAHSAIVCHPHPPPKLVHLARL